MAFLDAYFSHMLLLFKSQKSFEKRLVNDA